MKHTKTYEKLVRQWSSLNDRELDSYKANSSEKAYWVCDKGHVWRASIKGRFSGHNCPYCGGRRPVKGVNDVLTLFPELELEWDLQKNGGRSLSDYLRTSEIKGYWTCPKGHVWVTSIKNRTRGRGCPYCNNRLPTEDDNLLAVFPKIAAMWDYAKNKYPPEHYRPRSGERVWWICEKGHSWHATIHTMSNPDRNRGCPFCRGKRPIPGETDLATVCPWLVPEWDYSLNEKQPEEYTSMSNKKVHWICPNGHKYKAMISNRTKGRGCSLCNRGWAKKTP